MSDYPGSLLSKDQRRLIQGEVEKQGTNRSSMKTRMKDRIYHGMATDGHLLPKISREDRRAIFRRWEGKTLREVPDFARDPDQMLQSYPSDSLARNSFAWGIAGLLEFIYAGVQEGNVTDFEWLLEQAIDQAARERGQYVENLELNIEFNNLPTLEELHQVFKSDEYSDKLTAGHLAVLYREGYIDDDDLDEFLYGGEPPEDEDKSRIFGPHILDPRTGSANRNLEKYYRKSPE